MTLENLEIVFNITNLAVLPFWGLMVIVPQWQGTQKLMNSLVPFALLAVIYIGLFTVSLDPDQAAIWSNPTLGDLAALFSLPPVMATGWTHFLVMDLFVGRWIYQQGLEQGIFTRHSLALCLFAGPAGLLSHIITAWLTGVWRQKSDGAAMESSEA
ncbi:MAG: ABA4-like family protein [Synechococcus sp.]|nr:ABA4-like family protein [Synechococcus sp.]